MSASNLHPSPSVATKGSRGRDNRGEDNLDGDNSRWREDDLDGEDNSRWRG